MIPPNGLALIEAAALVEPYGNDPVRGSGHYLTDRRSWENIREALRPRRQGPLSTHLSRQIADRAIPEPDIQYHLGVVTSQSLAGIADTARFRHSESLAQFPKPHARCGRGDFD
jgi:hypothetical protein